MKVRKINYDTNEPNYFQGNNNMSFNIDALKNLLNGYLLISLGELYNNKNFGINWLGVMNDGDMENIVFAVRQSLINFKNNNPKWNITQIIVKIESFNSITKKLNINVQIKSLLGDLSLDVNR